MQNNGEPGCLGDTTVVFRHLILACTGWLQHLECRRSHRLGITREIDGAFRPPCACSYDAHAARTNGLCDQTREFFDFVIGEIRVLTVACGEFEDLNAV